LATGADTLVFLMGMRRLEELTARLIHSGCPPSRPAALVHWGTTPRQRVVVAPLAEIARQAQAEGINPPAVLIVGEVVSLRQRLAWYDSKPLFGKRILVTRSAEQAEALSQLLREAGAEPVELQTIVILPPDSFSAFDQAVGHFDRYDWAVFTSVNGVRCAVQRLLELGLDIRALHGPCLAAVGSATAEALTARGLKVELVPEVFTTEALAQAFAALPAVRRGKRVALVRAQEASQVLPTVLRQLGARVEELPVYRIGPAAPNAKRRPSGAEVVEQINAGSLATLTFTSPSAFRNFIALEGLQRERIAASVIACIGPVTAQAVREAGFEPRIVASEQTVAGLVRALEDYYRALG